MPIATFRNQNPDPLFLVIEPSEQRFEVPSLSSIGVRYALKDGVGDRSHSTISSDIIYFWCDERFEVEVVHPTPFDRLLWDLCVGGGCCGSICRTSGEPLHVTGFLPKAGIVTAETFAASALQAEQWPEVDDESYPRHLERLKALFITHMGKPEVPAEALVQNLALPFEGADQR